MQGLRCAEHDLVPEESPVLFCFPRPSAPRTFLLIHSPTHTTFFCACLPLLPGCLPIRCFPFLSLVPRFLFSLLVLIFPFSISFCHPLVFSPLSFSSPLLASPPPVNFTQSTPYERDPAASPLTMRSWRGTPTNEDDTAARTAGADDLQSLGRPTSRHLVGP